MQRSNFVISAVTISETSADKDNFETAITAVTVFFDFSANRIAFRFLLKLALSFSDNNAQVSFIRDVDFKVFNTGGKSKSNSLGSSPVDFQRDCAHGAC